MTSNTRAHTLRRIGALMLAVAGASAIAADSPPPPAPRADPLAAARSAVKGQQWSAAAAELKRVNAQDSADWNNLMGFVLRKQAQPDLDGAQRHYDTALRIDPKHMGALEYSGELALMKRDLPTAEARLAALAQLCKSPCEPLDDLRQSIGTYKAANKP
jgi:hypothetical protein